MRRFLIFFSYIGTGFRGVQRQIPRDLKVHNAVPSITEVIEEALKTRLKLDFLPCLYTASRTDAGVHALRTAASVDLDLPTLPPDVITVTLNQFFCKAQVPIRILSTQVVKPDFSARYSPLQRSYLYRFAVLRPSVEIESPFRYTYFVPTPIQEYKRCHFVHNCSFNPAAVEEVLPLFHGLKDYASFMAKVRNNEPEHTNRRLDSVVLEPGNPLLPCFADQYYDYWQVKVVGKSFLYKQIRRTVAVLLAVGQGLMNYSDVKSLFDNPGTWNQKARSLPAYGLYLTDVVYNKEDLEAPQEPPQEEIPDPINQNISPKDLVDLTINEKINLRNLNLQLDEKNTTKKENNSLTIRQMLNMTWTKNSV